MKNWALLRETRDYIATHPEDWYQESWRCESGMCFAGTAAVIAGGEWAAPLGEVLSSYLVADEPKKDGYAITYEGRRVISASNRADYLLNLDYEESDALFAGYNTLEDIDAILHRWAMNEDWSEAYEEDAARSLREGVGV